MTSAPLDLSHTDTPRQIQESLIAYMRLFAGLLGMDMGDAESFWFISHHSAPGNVILRARLSAPVEDQIDTLLDQVGQHISEIDWLVFPDDQPGDLNQRLEVRGMPGNAGEHWLYAALKTLGAAPAVPDHFHIEQVRDDDQMRTWTRASEEGFGGEYPHFYDAYARHGYGADAISLHYIGYLDDVPVTSGTLLDVAGGAAIYDISTPPAYRQQGFAGAITHYLMRVIRSRGYTDTWISASPIAKNLYRKLGYVDADFGLREHRWQK